MGQQHSLHQSREEMASSLLCDGPLFKKSYLLAYPCQCRCWSGYYSLSESLWKTKHSLWPYVPFWSGNPVYCFRIPAASGFSACCAVFSRKGYPFDNVCCESFFNILRKKKPTAIPIALYHIYSFPFLNTLRAPVILKDLTPLSTCLLLTRLNSHTGSRIYSLFLNNFLFSVYLLNYTSEICFFPIRKLSDSSNFSVIGCYD